MSKQTRKSLGWWALNIFAWGVAIFYACWANAEEATLQISATFRDAMTVAASPTEIIAPDAVQVNGGLILVLQIRRSGTGETAPKQGNLTPVLQLPARDCHGCG